MQSNIIVKRYEPSEYEMWNNHIKAAKNSLFMFDRNYMDYHKDRFEDHSLMFFKNDKLMAVFPANEKEGSLYSHGGLTYGGMISNEDMHQMAMLDCFAALRKYCLEHSINRILYKAIPHVYHVQPAEEDKYALYRNGAKLVETSASTVINLKQPIKMTKGRKAQINRARREGVRIELLTDIKAFKAFIEMENKILESRHNTHAVHNYEELHMLYERFPDSIHLYGAFLNDDFIAGVVIYEYDQVIHTQYMASNELARKVGGLDLIINIIIEKYKETKLWLDFGISTENGGRYLNEGLISQKEGFGGRTNIYEIWELVL